MISSKKDQDSNKKTIGEDEVQYHLIYIQQALNSQSADERKKALIEGLIRFGIRFNDSLSYLAELTNQQGQYQALAAESQEILVDWLGGKRMTDRVDEDERRARMAVSLIEGEKRHPRLSRLAAGAILALPEDHSLRDVESAHRTLRQHLERCDSEGDVEGLLMTIQDILKYNLESADCTLQLIEQYRQYLDQCSDRNVKRNFQVQVFGFYIQKAIGARNNDDSTAQKKWTEKAKEQFDNIRLDESASALNSKDTLLLALLLELSDHMRDAADTYALVAASVEKGDTAVLAAQHEGRICMVIGEYKRAVKVLTPIVQTLEESYLTAVEDSDIISTGEAFCKVVINLAFAHAYLSHWGEAIRILDQGKSLRLRYRAALRESPSAGELLELEKALHTLSRGVKPNIKLTRKEKPADWLGSEISLHTQFLENYRQQRPQLSNDLLTPPAIDEVAAVLAPDEAVAVLGTSFAGTLMAVIYPGDDKAPGDHLLLKNWNSKKLLPIFTGEHEDGWLFALGAPGTNGNRKEVLSSFLAGWEEVIGVPLGSLLQNRGVRRVTIVPHRWLHLVPFWALPGLTEYQVAISPSLAHLVKSRRQKHAGGRRILAAANPTLDLPLSPIEVSSLKQYLSTPDWELIELNCEKATEDSIVNALSGVSLFHFCGHGISDLINPTRSALLVYPDTRRFQWPGSDPFQPLVDEVSVWHNVNEEERYADLPGDVRLYEFASAAVKGIERRLEYGESGTLWGKYSEKKLVKLAELWTAGDIMVQDSLSQCRLAFLSACETGIRGLTTSIDEYSGLPAAFHLAGVPTVVCSLWPVSDVLTALYVELFYSTLAELTQSQQPVDIAALVKRVGKCLKSMKKEEAADRLSSLRSRTSDAEIRFHLEALAKQIETGDDLPFSHPYDWAAFYVIGSNEIRFS